MRESLMGYIKTLARNSNINASKMVKDLILSASAIKYDDVTGLMIVWNRREGFVAFSPYDDKVWRTWKVKSKLDRRGTFKVMEKEIKSLHEKGMKKWQ